MKFPCIVEWIVQKYVYVPERLVVSMVTGGGGALGVKLAEQVSPVEQEPVNLAPSRSRSRANWWSVSVLDNMIVTMSPWLTVIVGFVTGPLAFQLETVPERWIVTAA